MTPEEFEKKAGLFGINPKEFETLKQEASKLGAIKPTPSAPVSLSLTNGFKRDTEWWLNKFITVDDDMVDLKNKVRKLAMRKEPVLILGETGTGKELIASALHGNRVGPFVDINCGGFPEHLIESELFGSIKGSFTGSVSDKQGLFQAAQGGTLFIDEIGELPILMQSKLLRVIQERVIRRIGSTTNEPVDCRIVAATNCNLNQMVTERLFREDLYWRLSTFVLQIKSLAERVCDIELIAKSLGYIARPATVGEQEFMNTYEWPGNVRELQQYILRKQVLG